jgi:ABC-2 type transport system ATP-binding protein
MAAQDVTVLLTTQYLEEADVLSDSIIILDSGRIVASGTADDLKRQTGYSYCEVTLVNPADVSRVAAVLGDLGEVETDYDENTVAVPAAEGPATLAEVLRRVDRLGAELTDISLRKPSLDEVFLHLTRPAVTA